MMRRVHTSGSMFFNSYSPVRRHPVVRYTPASQPPTKRPKRNQQTNRENLCRCNHLKNQRPCEISSAHIFVSTFAVEDGHSKDVETRNGVRLQKCNRTVCIRYDSKWTMRETNANQKVAILAFVAQKN